MTLIFTHAQKQRTQFVLDTIPLSTTGFRHEIPIMPLFNIPLLNIERT